ncbi:hypothetical protein [Chitinophaga sp. Ak27]|uniref:hypothetical protein n=1 Tax=Chitinophaga sp. Ak27 TaxID=2726116 RepID=UPI00145F5C65|nr:hypothetical protein [Chitinophaga sp. Ak27]NLU92204.1 hypothetical protein [Chitinophaga sp. Ak27]
MRIFLISLIGFLIGLNLGCINSNSKRKKENIDTTGVYLSSNLFVRAISTKDTLVFNKVIDGDKLFVYLKRRHPGESLSRQELFFPFFFVFSPLKMRMDSLIAKRDENLFRMFKINSIKYLDENEAEIEVLWNTTLSDENQRISLILIKENKDWKIKGAEWEELPE